MDDQRDTTSTPSRPAPSPLMFWALLLLACVVFAPCVLVPVLQDYRALVVARALERRQIEESRAAVKRQERHLEALRSDPAVAARIAQRDLAYTRPGETSVPVVVTPVARRVASDQPLPAARPPAPVERLMSWIPFSDRANVYCSRNSRLCLMCLSAALLVAAFVLYPPRRARHR